MMDAAVIRGDTLQIFIISLFLVGAVIVVVVIIVGVIMMVFHYVVVWVVVVSFHGGLLWTAADARPDHVVNSN